MKRYRLAQDLIIFVVTVSFCLLNRRLRNVSNLILCDTIRMFLRCYANDLVGTIGFIAYCDFIFTLGNKHMRLQHIILLLVVCCIMWEIITPIYINSTADTADCIAYCIGALVYLLIPKKGAL